MDLKPLNNNVLVKPILESNKTSSGIIIPATADQEIPNKGIIASVGAGKYVDGKTTPIGVKVGQIILFKKYSNETIKYKGEEYIIVHEDDILCICL